MSRLFLLLSIVIIVPAILFSSPVAHAQTGATEFVPDIKFPGLFEREPQDSLLLGKYIRAVFVYMVYTIGVLSVVMLIFGGIKWVAAAGNPGAINDAKDVITNAIIGLIIGLTSVLILNIINPEFTVLRIDNVNSAKVDYFTGAKVTRICTNEEIKTIDDKMENFTCGKLHELPDTRDVASDITTADFCISALCVGGKLCVLSKTNTGQWRPGRGCMDRIPTQATEGVLKGDQTVPVSFINGYSGGGSQPVPVHCGQVSVSQSGGRYTSSMCENLQQKCIGIAIPVKLENWSNSSYPSLGESERYSTKDVACY